MLDDLDDVDEDNEDAFVVSGTAEPGSTVNVTVTDGDGTTVTGTATAGDDGRFSVTLDVSGLDDGTLTVSATATDEAGNTSAAATQNVTKDTGDDMPPGDGDDDDDDVADDGTVIERIFASGRTQTALEISRNTFADGEADAVVLSRPDIFPDALAGTPLAVQENGPLLLTSSDGIEAEVATEISRVLGDSGTVYVLGGVQALSADVATDAEGLGFDVVRYGGANRFETAVIITTVGIDDPSAILLADGSNFPDAVTAGAAAGATGGAVLLTGADTVPPETAAFLATNDDDLFAIGGPASRAVPSAVGVVGATRIATSVAVAGQFFDAPPVVGIATAGDFPDALAGGAAVARDGGPMLLTFTDSLDQDVSDYLTSTSETIDRVVLFGGTQALSQAVEDAVNAIFDPTP